MNSIPKGNWHIECVIVNGTTVMNNEGIRGLEIFDDQWVIQPSNQQFEIRQATADSAVLESNGEVYYADFKVSGSRLSIKMSRPNIKETVTMEAVAITADVYSST